MFNYFKKLFQNPIPQKEDIVTNINYYNYDNEYLINYIICKKINNYFCYFI